MTNCTACGSPTYHPSTGHVFSETHYVCGPCARSWYKWLKGMMSRKWGKQNFYEHAITSVRPKEETDG